MTVRDGVGVPLMGGPPIPLEKEVLMTEFDFLKRTHSAYLSFLEEQYMPCEFELGFGAMHLPENREQYYFRQYQCAIGNSEFKFNLSSVLLLVLLECIHISNE